MISKSHLYSLWENIWQEGLEILIFNGYFKNCWPSHMHFVWNAEEMGSSPFQSQLIVFCFVFLILTKKSEQQENSSKVFKLFHRESLKIYFKSSCFKHPELLETHIPKINKYVNLSIPTQTQRATHRPHITAVSTEATEQSLCESLDSLTGSLFSPYTLVTLSPGVQAAAHSSTGKWLIGPATEAA